MPYTRHGHWYGQDDPDRPFPGLVARCGGPGLCPKCAVDAHRGDQGVTPIDQTLRPADRKGPDAMDVTAKVRCIDKTVYTSGTDRYAAVQFAPNYTDGRGNKVNGTWAYATPTLNLSMTLNGAAADLFKSGRDYTLTFTPDSGE